MSYYEYLILSELDQWNELWANGQFITNRKYLNRKFSLYALFDFFVEIELDTKTNKILHKIHFKTGEILNKYSGNIDISNL